MAEGVRRLYDVVTRIKTLDPTFDLMTHLEALYARAGEKQRAIETLEGTLGHKIFKLLRGSDWHIERHGTTVYLDWKEDIDLDTLHNLLHDYELGYKDKNMVTIKDASDLYDEIVSSSTLHDNMAKDPDVHYGM